MLRRASAAQTQLACSSPHEATLHQNTTVSSRCRCNGAGAGFQLYSLINDVGWDLRAFVGYAPVLGAKVVAFRGTDSHSWCGAMLHAPWTALPLCVPCDCGLALPHCFCHYPAVLKGPSENYQ